MKRYKSENKLFIKAWFYSRTLCLKSFDAVLLRYI